MNETYFGRQAQLLQDLTLHFSLKGATPRTVLGAAFDKDLSHNLLQGRRLLR